MINTVNLGKKKFNQPSDHISLIQQVAKDYKTGQLQIINSLDVYSFFLEDGYLYYAVSSSQSWEIFQNKIQALIQVNPMVKAQIQRNLNYHQLLICDRDEKANIANEVYLEICWLVNEHYLTVSQASKLTVEIIAKVLDFFERSHEGVIEFTQSSFMENMPKFCLLDPADINYQRQSGKSKQMTETSWFEDNLEFGQKFSEQLFAPPQAIELLLAPVPSETKIEPDFDSQELFFDLAPEELLEQTELPQQQLDGTVNTTLKELIHKNSTQNIAPEITESTDSVENSVHEPIRNIDFQMRQLPPASMALYREILQAESLKSTKIELENLRLSKASDDEKSLLHSNLTPKPQQNNPDSSISNTKDQSQEARKLYKVLCIDDSPTILKAIRGYLDEQIFNVIGVDDSLKALMEILRHKPDVILLDISMPNLDGYELCSLLRKHAKFQHTPIIMVTGRTGLIDKARAKLVKSSGYLTKPFSKAELLKLLFQHLAVLEK